MLLHPDRSEILPGLLLSAVVYVCPHTVHDVDYRYRERLPWALFQE